MEIFYAEIERWQAEQFSRGRTPTVIEANQYLFGWAQQNGHFELHRAHADEIRTWIEVTVGGGRDGIG